MKTRRGAFSALCIAGLLVAACGSDKKTSSGTAAPGGTTAPAATAADLNAEFLKLHNQRTGTMLAPGDLAVRRGAMKHQAGPNVYEYRRRRLRALPADADQKNGVDAHPVSGGQGR